MIRVHTQVAALTMKHRLALPVGGGDMPAVVTGLAGVAGVHGHEASTLVLQTLGQLAPVTGQYAPVQAGLDLDVAAGLRLGPPAPTSSCFGSVGPRPRGYAPCPPVPG